MGYMENMQVARLSGRGFGKTAQMRGPRAMAAVNDEVTAQTAAIVNAPKARTATARRKQRQAVAVACPHAEVQWLPLANDRYWRTGRVNPPYAIEYVRHVVPVKGPHACVPGVER